MTWPSVIGQSGAPRAEIIHQAANARAAIASDANRNEAALQIATESVMRALRRLPNGPALSCRPPVSVPARTAGCGRIVPDPRSSPPAAGSWAPRQAPKRRPVSCSALLDGASPKPLKPLLEIAAALVVPLPRVLGSLEFCVGPDLIGRGAMSRDKEPATAAFSVDLELGGQTKTADDRGLTRDLVGHLLVDRGWAALSPDAERARAVFPLPPRKLSATHWA